MKIAIPAFGTRVSPRFDCAEAILLVTVDEGRPSGRQELVASGWAPHERVNSLIELGVDTVICGGMDCWSLESLQSAGITVYGWVTGEIEDALAVLLRGVLESRVPAGSGGRCGWRRFPGNGGSRNRSPGSGRNAGRGGGRGRGRRGKRGGGGPGGF